MTSASADRREGGAGASLAPATASRRLIWVLSLGAFGSSGMARVLDPLLPRLEHEFGVSLAQAAWALTAFVVAYGVMQVFYGPLSDRRGKLRVIRWTSACASLAALGCLLAHESLALLVLARGAAGAFCAATIPLAIAWIGDQVPEDQRKTVLARFMIGQMVGMASGQILGGWAGEHVFWSWPFGIYAVVYALVAVMLWTQADDTLPAMRAPESGGRWQSLVATLREPRVRRVLSASFAEGATFLGAFAFLATHLHREGGIALGLSGVLVAGFTIGGIGFALTAPRWLRLLDERQVIVSGSLMAACGMTAVACAPAVGVALPASVVAGLGFYMLHNTLQAAATQMMPARRGAAIAMFATAFFLGQSAGVALMGAVAARLGTTEALLLGALGIAAVGMRLRRGLRTDGGDAAARQGEPASAPATGMSHTRIAPAEESQ